MAMKWHVGAAHNEGVWEDLVIAEHAGRGGGGDGRP